MNTNYIMTQRHIEIIAENIYKSCRDLLNQRLNDHPVQKDINMKQLDDYYHMTPKDMSYLNNLQFLFENWAKSIPKTKEQETNKKDVVYFFKPHPK